MSVYEARYRKISEEKKTTITSVKAATTMSSFEVRRGLRGTWPKIPLILAGFIIFGFVVQLNSILLQPEETFWIGSEETQQAEGFSVQSAISILLTPLDGPGAIMIIHIAVISAGLIAGDLRDRAIDLYYSKISLGEYFISKIIASMILTFVGLPFMTIVYFFIALYKRWPDLSEFPLAGEVFLKMTAVIAIEVIFLSVLILVFSSFTTNPVNSGVVFLVFIFVTRVVFESILYEATNIDIFFVLSPLTALDVVRKAILSPDEVSDQFFELAIPILILYGIVSLLLVFIKLWREKNQ